jgi:glucokinase
MLLLADFGGTKTELALYSTEGPRKPLAQAEFRSASYPSLEASAHAGGRRAGSVRGLP